MAMQEQGGKQVKTHGEPGTNTGQPSTIGVHKLPIQPAPVRRDKIVHPRTNVNENVHLIHLQIFSQTNKQHNSASNGKENCAVKFICTLDQKEIGLDEAHTILSTIKNAAPIVTELLTKQMLPNCEFQDEAQLKKAEENKLSWLYSKIMELSQTDKISLLNTVTLPDCPRRVSPKMASSTSKAQDKQKGMHPNYCPISPPTNEFTFHGGHPSHNDVNVKLIKSHDKPEGGNNARDTSEVTHLYKTANVLDTPSYVFDSQLDHNLVIAENMGPHYESEKVMTVQCSACNRLQNHHTPICGYNHPRYYNYAPMEVDAHLAESRAIRKQHRIMNKQNMQAYNITLKKKYVHPYAQNDSWVSSPHPDQITKVNSIWENNGYSIPDAYMHRPRDNAYYASYPPHRFITRYTTNY